MDRDRKGESMKGVGPKRRERDKVKGCRREGKEKGDE